MEETTVSMFLSIMQLAYSATCEKYVTLVFGMVPRVPNHSPVCVLRNNARTSTTRSCYWRYTGR